MEFSEFSQIVKLTIPVGTILKNPGGGTSIIKSYSSEYIRYQRENSVIAVSLRDLFNAFAQFKDHRLSSTDLKMINPSVFDSTARPAGHSCNCTFLFMILLNIGVIKHIYGRGVKGDPFYVILPK